MELIKTNHSAISTIPMWLGLFSERPSLARGKSRRKKRVCNAAQVLGIVPIHNIM